MSDPITLGILGLVVLIAIRMPIAYAMILVGGIGTMLVNGPALVLSQMKTLAWGQFANYDLSVVPMFVLMGVLASKAGLSQALFRAAAAWLGHLRGGTAMAAIAACAGFGAVCGSSLATASTMGRVALPELRRYNYEPSLATGVLAAGGVLGILIPPSVVLIIYAIIVEANVVTLFAAAAPLTVVKRSYVTKVLQTACTTIPIPMITMVLPVMDHPIWIHCCCSAIRSVWAWPVTWPITNSLITTATW